jgi:hypothetical protein
MRQQDFDELQRGDLVRHATDPRVFVVTGAFGGRATAVATADLTTADEWVLIGKACAGYATTIPYKSRGARP